MQMSTRKTTTGYRVTVDIDPWQENFDYYEDVKVCFKNVLRGYDLDRVTTDFRLANWEMDYLLGNISKKEALENEPYVKEFDFKKLDDYKKDYQVVGLSIGEHSSFSVWYWDDWVMLAPKDANPEFIRELVKELDAWFNWEVYRVDVYEPVTFKSEELTPRKLTYWERVDGWSWYFNLKDALDSLPDYAGKIIEESETSKFEDIERC